MEVGGGGDLESDQSTLFHDIRVWDDVIEDENIESLYLNDANNGGGYPTAAGPWSHWRMNNLASPVQRATKAFKIQMEDSLRSSDHVDYIRAHAYAGETLQKQNWAYLSSKTSKGLESYMESGKLVAQQGRATFKCATCHNINDWYCRISDDRSQVKACFFSDDAIQERCGQWSSIRSVSPRTENNPFHTICELTSTTAIHASKHVSSSAACLILLPESNSVTSDPIQRPSVSNPSGKVHASSLVYGRTASQSTDATVSGVVQLANRAINGTEGTQWCSKTKRCLLGKIPTVDKTK
jgi:hypothetical protein